MILSSLLNCNDLNVQKVMEMVESRRHQRINMRETLQNCQKQQIQAQQAAAAAARDEPPASASPLHRTASRQTAKGKCRHETRRHNLLASLRNTFGTPDDSLGLAALEAADYDEALVGGFIEEMGPIDE